MKNITAVIDIGSYSIVTLIGERGVNGSFKILGKGEVSYDGFGNGKFYSPDDVKNVIAMSIANAEQTSGQKIVELFVGVPGEFCNNYTKDVSVDFGKSKKVKSADLSKLLAQGVIKSPVYSVINNSIVFCTLDESKRVMNPVGKVCSKLSARVSYVLAENNFLDFISNIMLEIGVKHVMFVSSNLAEANYLLDPEIRDRYAILVDCGYLTTNVMLCQGDGLLFLNSFSLGGGHITGDLCEVLKINFTQAESLKRKIILNWQAEENDTYEVLGNEFISTYSAKVSNEIAESRIEILANYIQKCLERCEYEFPDYLPVYLTGGGLSYIKGIKDFLGRKLGRRVEIMSPNLAQSTRPDYSSELALLAMAIYQSENGYNIIYSTRW